MWGVVPGKGPNIVQYRKARPGDLVLFGGDSRYFSCGTIAFLMHNQVLAEALWQRDEEGQTWEYMYVLDEIRPLQIPYPEFNQIAGYKPNAAPQGFRVLNAGQEPGCPGQPAAHQRTARGGRN